MLTVYIFQIIIFAEMNNYYSPIQSAVVHVYSVCVVCSVHVGALHFTTDMIRRGNLRTRSIKLLVLDEADEMLAKGITVVYYMGTTCMCIKQDSRNRFMIFIVICHQPLRYYSTAS